MSDTNSPEFLMSKAKAALLLNSPFFGMLACSMTWEKTDSVPTMATDGFKYYWNPEWIKTKTTDELVFVHAHEILHVVFEHVGDNGRVGERDPKGWNFATDICINQILTKDGLTMPDGGLLNPELYEKGDGIAEKVYELLPRDENGNLSTSAGDGYKQPEKPESGDGQGNPAPLDELLKAAGMSPAEIAEAKQEMKVRVAQAQQAAKMAGKMPGELEKFIGSILNPKVDWRKVLREFVVSKAKTDFTYAKPNRRFAHLMEEDDAVLRPSRTGDVVGKIVVAIDCSGSCWDALDEFAAEILAISEDCKPEEVHVVYFDTQVSHHDVYEKGEAPEIKAHGGGGTMFSPIFEFVEKQGIDPVGCVVLTDLYASDFGPAPAYPVLWVTNGTTEAPWGNVVEM